MRRGRLLVVVLVLFLLTVLVGSVVAIISMLRGGGTSVEEGSVLVVDIGGPLPEQPMPEQPIQGLGKRWTSMLEIDSALRKAAVDDRIERVLIRPQAMAAGHAKVQELRSIIQRFKDESDGKPVTCWMEDAGNREYYLATACDEIFMAPEGFLLLNGLHIGVTFYKGTLDKLGVEAEFARAGRYKSAIEPLTSEQMSPAFREMMEELADSLFDEMVGAIADSRGMTRSQVEDLIDDPPFTAAGGVRAGLIDGLYYRDQLFAHLSGRTVEPIAADLRPAFDFGGSEAPPAGTGSLGQGVGLAGEVAAPAAETEVEGGADAIAAQPEGEAADPDGADPKAAQAGERKVAVTDGAAPAGEEQGEEALADAEDSAPASGSADDEEEIERISLEEYRSVDPGSFGLGKGPKVAVLFCEGQITSGPSSPGGTFGGGSMGSDTIAGALRKIREDDSIEALVIRVDSPGGSGLASDVIWREVDLVAGEKPVVVSMSDYAASGGYYISMGAATIVAEPGTLTGSIGVFAGKYNLSGLYEKIGLTTESVKRGEMSDLFSADRALGEAGRAKLSEFVDEFYAGFVSKAARGRMTSPEAIHAVAQGRVWTGRQALAVGLVDELGSFRTALEIAKDKAGIDGEARLVLFPRQPTFIEQILGSTTAPGTLAPLLDGWALGGRLPDGTALRAARAMLDAAPLFADGRPVLMTPYHVEAL